MVELLLKETLNDLLLNYSFPLYTEIQYALNNVKTLIANTLNSVKPKVWAYGTETSEVSKTIKTIITLEPNNRTGIWLADVLGSTGKTVFSNHKLKMTKLMAYILE